MTIDKKKTRGKREIVKDLMAKGFTARESARVLNVVIDSWKFALWCGEEVEVPGGILQAKITKGTEDSKLQVFRDISTKELKVRTIRGPGRRAVVKLKPDPALGLTPDPPPPPPLPPPAPPPPPATAEEIEERQLTTELLGLQKPADEDVMRTVRQAVGAHPWNPDARLTFKPGALLRRLREFKAKRFFFNDVRSLAYQVSCHHWL